MTRSVHGVTETLVVVAVVVVALTTSASLVAAETEDYGYGSDGYSSDPAAAVDVSGTQLLSGTVTSTGPSAEQPFVQPEPST